MAKKKVQRPPDATDIDSPFWDFPDPDRTATYAEAGERTVAYDAYPTLSAEAAQERSAAIAAAADRTSDGEHSQETIIPFATGESDPGTSRGAASYRGTVSASASPTSVRTTATPATRAGTTATTSSAPRSPARPIPRSAEPPTATHEAPRPPALPPPLTFTPRPTPPPPAPMSDPRARPSGPPTRSPTHGEAGASALCERSEPRAEPEGTESACPPQPSRGVPCLAKKGSVEAPPAVAALGAPPPPVRAAHATLLPPPAPPAAARPRAERRPLPRAAKVTIATVGAIVVALLALSRQSGPKPSAEPRLAFEDKLAVSEEDLKRRREVKPEDLRPRELTTEPAPPRAPVAAPPPESAASSDALAERRRRRANDPNDVMSHRKPPRPASRSAEADLYRRPLGASPGGASKKGGLGGSAEAGAPNKRLAAGTTLRGTLATPLRLRGGTGGATAVATLDRSVGRLRGARLLGQASVAGDRLELRFRKMVLPSGEEVAIQAEAQSLDGAFGLPVALDENNDEGADGDDDEDGSVIGEVATDTATEVVTDALGMGIPGRAATNYLQRSRSRANRPTRRVTTVELPAGTRLQVFFHEAADLP